jgi:hypothetical protein
MLIKSLVMKTMQKSYIVGEEGIHNGTRSKINHHAYGGPTILQNIATVNHRGSMSYSEARKNIWSIGSH